MAGVAAVKHLRLVRLGHGNPAVPSDLGCIITEPHDLKAEHVAKLGHCLLHVEISEAGTDHVPHFATRLPPAACRRCGADLAGAPVTAQRRHQVTDIVPVPSPKITEYVAQAKECAGCGTVSAGELPAHVRARASYGPETCAQAANWPATTTSPSTGRRCCYASWPASRSRLGG